jgi:hypothetical protein
VRLVHRQFLCCLRRPCVPLSRYATTAYGDRLPYVTTLGGAHADYGKTAIMEARPGARMERSAIRGPPRRKMKREPRITAARAALHPGYRDLGIRKGRVKSWRRLSATQHSPHCHQFFNIRQLPVGLRAGPGQLTGIG